jgi:hypothetical protein
MRYAVDGGYGMTVVVGDEELCPIYSITGSWPGPMIHACKDRCHKAAVVYEGTLSKTHPEYLAAVRGTQLYLNLIDPPVALFQADSFTRALDFLDEHAPLGKPVAIHCNQGFSRAPSLALVWLAKRAKRIPDCSYQEARKAFESMIPPQVYRPGQGIESYLKDNWGAIG